MKYVILDYVNPNRKVFSVKKGKKYELLKHLRMYRQLKQLKVERQDIDCGEYAIIRIVIHAYLGELKLFPKELIKKKIWETLTLVPEAFVQNEGYQGLYMFQAADGLKEYVPDKIIWTRESDDLCLDFFQKMLEFMCERDYVDKSKEKLILLDDGTRDIRLFLGKLCKDWNYVCVYSKRHEELEEEYAHLYKEAGLMVECWYECPHNAVGGVVVDLTGCWNGVHRIYPKDSKVLDATFSREKEKYLQVKDVKLNSYVQLFSKKGISPENMLEPEV